MVERKGYVSCVSSSFCSRVYMIESAFMIMVRAVCSKLLLQVYERIGSSWAEVWRAVCRGRKSDAATDETAKIKLHVYLLAYIHCKSSLADDGPSPLSTSIRIGDIGP